ncbi:hypothetical protein FP2506_11502 [Fulvimarina pelagi HTCC2506]|uniref:Uncharacterized protein n=1 Tax=Fulvimarina pelagi HTCC2506 TaxID=314231 RepID=Q0FYX9_9HYPH|nr:hypothetical protein [Fulvimarina pelagi]EAU40179.1 hypothetical protein FP2506_11502 [Fulvimarina pelagi HTCC2506]
MHLSVRRNAGDPLMRLALGLISAAIFAVLFTAFVVLMTIGATTAAFAQTVADGAIDLGPLVEVLLPIALSVAAAIWAVLRFWAFRLLKRKTGWDLDAMIGPIVDQGLQRGIDFATERLKDRAIGGIPVNMKNQAIETVADYAIDKLPDALRHFGLVDADRRPTTKLSEMIEGRLEGWLVDPETERADAQLARSART